MSWKHPEYINRRTLKASEVVGGRQADADECYQFAEIGAVQDEAGDGWACQNAWVSFWLTASYAGRLLLFPRKTLCRVTHLEAMNLFTKEDPSFPLTCCVQPCVCSAEAAPARRLLRSLPTLLLATWQRKFLIPVYSAPCAVCTKPLQPFRAFLLQGPAIPERHCIVCQSLNQMKEQDLLCF